jgi:predicted aldo/keto reductase-like oxidoreductase
MSFGEPERGNQPWSLGEDDVRVIIRRALEAGINFLDTANVYSDAAVRRSSGGLSLTSAHATKSCSRQRFTGGCAPDRTEAGCPARRS